MSYGVDIQGKVSYLVPNNHRKPIAQRLDIHIENARRTIKVAKENNIPFDAQLVRDHKEFHSIS